MKTIIQHFRDFQWLTQPNWELNQFEVDWKPNL